MPIPRGPLRRHFYPLFILCIVVFLLVFFSSSTHQLATTPSSISRVLNPNVALDDSTLTGHAIAPKLGNETAKAELGRAAWKLFHTMMARFPDTPTEDESAALKSYIHLFQRLYPCGECAEHFGRLLIKYPPQVSSRSTAAAWACHVHNKVNESLNKDLFDCANIGDFYDCGCAEDEEEKSTETATVKVGHEKPEMSDERKERLQTNGRDFNTDLLLPR